MKYIGELRQWQRDSLRELTAGTDLVDKLRDFELELEDVLKQLLSLWEEAEAVFKKEGLRAFLEYYRAAEQNKDNDPLRFNICCKAVEGTHFLEAWESDEAAKKYVDGRKAFGMRPGVFRLLSNVGNPNWKKKVDVKTVVTKANELWDRHGVERYHFKDRRGSVYTQTFLEDIAEELRADGYDVKSLTTIRKRLYDAGYELPQEAHYYRVHPFFK